MADSRTVAVFVGTRADLGPLTPVIEVLAEAPDVDLHLLTGVMYGADDLERALPGPTGSGAGVHALAGPMTEVYNPKPFKWDEPETTSYNGDPFSIPTDGGLDFECSWTNTTNARVGFGESATDEMCFFWAYYFPSQGSKVCIHTDMYGGANGLNVCCPGDSLCSQIPF